MIEYVKGMWTPCKFKVIFKDRDETRELLQVDAGWIEKTSELHDHINIIEILDFSLSEEQNERCMKIKYMPEGLINQYKKYVEFGVFEDIELVTPGHPFRDLYIFETEKRLELFKRSKSAVTLYEEYRGGEIVDLGHLISLKTEALREQCGQDIYNGFDFEILDKLYSFSFDAEAQSNFVGVMAALASTISDTIPEWTVRLNGVHTRIQMTVDVFKAVAVRAFHVKDEKINRLRNNLIPMLSLCETAEDVDSVNW